ncbi:EAL domain-containing protein [candidate division KSB1 bacterium]|nr:EAL domain-containing protein [candidate division KSB1 bacterium]
MNFTKIKRSFLVSYLISIATVLGILIVTVAGLYVSEVNSKHEKTSQSAELLTEKAQGIVLDLFSAIVSDIKYLAGQYAIFPQKGISPTDSYRLLSENYLIFSDQRDSYDQIRLIDNLGNEQLRIDNYDHRAQIISPNLLQNNLNHPYVFQTFKLKQHQIFVSAFDLNVEHGQLEEPYKPVIRFGIPLCKESQEPDMILVLNYKGSDLIHKLKNAFNDLPGQVFLTDEDGHWIIGPSPSDEWGHVLKANQNKMFKTHFDEKTWQLINAKTGHVFSNPFGIFVHHKIMPHDELNRNANDKNVSELLCQSYWQLIYFIPNEEIQTSGFKHLKNILPFVLAVFVFISVILWFYLKSRIRNKVDQARIRLLAKVFENSREGIILTDPNGKILEVNNAFMEITGYHKKEVINQTPRILKSGWNDHNFYVDMWDQLKLKGFWQGEIWDRRKSGELYGQWLRISSIRSDKKGELSNYIGMSSDITERKQAQVQVHKLAYYDVLTGLPNRTLFMDRLGQAIAEAIRSKKMVALLFIDFDNFKQINDTLGHLIGDKFLQHVANTLTAKLREIDTISRLGGDEFTVILKNISNSITPVYVAQKIVDAFSSSHYIEQHEVFSSVSIGIAMYPQDSTDINELIKLADIAMYQAKEMGKNNYQLYHDDMNEAVMERSKIETRLRNSIQNDELFLYYQPQIDIKDHKVIGLEALIRWKNSDLGLVSPDKFISIAEESHLILDLTDWVLEQACLHLKNMVNEGFADLRLSINISSNYLKQRNITTHVLEIINSVGVPMHLLDFEITEKAFFDSIEDTAEKLNIFKSCGISISVDDFGTGYSSMNYLRRFPIDRLKIDKSLIQHIPSNQNDVEISRAIIALANALQMEVVAEGVETEEQLEFLKYQNCRIVQGFYFSRPKPPKDVLDFVRHFQNEEMVVVNQTANISDVE